VQRVRINIQNVVANIIVEKGNKVNVSVINNIFAKKKTKRQKMNVNIRNDSGRVFVT